MWQTVLVLVAALLVCAQRAVMVSVDWCMQGWNLAMKNAQLCFPERAEEIDALIKQRISGNLKVQHPASSLLSYPILMSHDSCNVALIPWL